MLLCVILKNGVTGLRPHTPFLLDRPDLESASLTKLVFELVRALSERRQHVNFGPIEGIFSSYRGHSPSWHIRAMEDQRSNGAINRNKHFLGCKTKRGIRNWIPRGGDPPPPLTPGGRADRDITSRKETSPQEILATCLIC